MRVTEGVAVCWELEPWEWQQSSRHSILLFGCVFCLQLDEGRFCEGTSDIKLFALWIFKTTSCGPQIHINLLLSSCPPPCKPVYEMSQILQLFWGRKTTDHESCVELMCVARVEAVHLPVYRRTSSEWATLLEEIKNAMLVTPKSTEGINAVAYSSPYVFHQWSSPLFQSSQPLLPLESSAQLSLKGIFSICTCM